MHYAMKIGAFAAAGAMLFGAPATVAAQEDTGDLGQQEEEQEPGIYMDEADGTGEDRSPISVQARAGVAIPTGDLDAITSVGPSFGGGIAWHFDPHFAIRGDLQWSRLDDASDELGNVFVPLHLLYFGGGLQIDFAAPSFQHEPMTFRVNLGAGATNIKADESFNVPVSPEVLAFDNTYLTVNAGGQVGYEFSPKVAMFARTQAMLLLTDADDVVPLIGASAEAEPFDTAWFFPVTLGLRVSLP